MSFPFLCSLSFYFLFFLLSTLLSYPPPLFISFKLFTSLHCFHLHSSFSFLASSHPFLPQCFLHRGLLMRWRFLYKRREGDSDKNRTSVRAMETKTGRMREVGNEEGRWGERGRGGLWVFIIGCLWLRKSDYSIPLPPHTLSSSHSDHISSSRLLLTWHETSFWSLGPLNI